MLEDTIPHNPNRVLRAAIQPLADFLDEMEHLGPLIELAVSGVQMRTNAVRLAKTMEEGHRALEHPISEREFARRRKHAREAQAIALKESANDFHRLYSLGTIAAWSGLEAAFHDFLVSWLRRYPEALGIDALAKVKIPLADFQSMSEDDRYYYLADQLENELRRPNRLGASRYEDLLSSLGLGGAVDSEVSKSLWEMHHVRNILVHRRGVADRRFVNACPWFGIKPGQQILIAQQLFYKYLHMGAGHYVADVIVRIIDRHKERQVDDNAHKENTPAHESLDSVSQ